MAITKQGVCKYIVFKGRNWITVAKESSDWLKARTDYTIIDIVYNGLDSDGRPTNIQLAIESYCVTIFYNEPLFKYDLTKLAVGFDETVLVPA